jgi:ABC-type nitrate/sulfonate/bicarbonate transport system substrate-binding protein
LCSSPPTKLRIEDLKGKKFGVSCIGSADNAAAQTVFARYGLKGDDVGYLTIGSVPARLAALQSNAIQDAAAAA